jgi:hypothetical protein
MRSAVPGRLEAMELRSLLHRERSNPHPFLKKRKVPILLGAASPKESKPLL